MNNLIEMLIKEGFITEAQLKESKVKQIGAKKPLHELLVEMNFVKEEDLMRVFSKVFNMPISKIKEEPIELTAVKIIPYEKARYYGVFPLRNEGDTLVLAMSNPLDILAMDDIKILTQLKIKPILSTKRDISECIERYYHADDMLYNLLKNVVEDKKIEIIREGKSLEDRFEMENFKDDYGPVPKLINFIFSDAVKLNASDIHIEPWEDSVRIKYRISGDLRDVIDVPRTLLYHIVARIKIMADLDLAETKKPQDGRISISVFKRKIDLRISIIPAYHGESVVIRLLDPQQAKIQVDKLGFAEEELKLFKDSCNKPQGMVLVTGPTGSGKTSTLYAALNFVKDGAKNIITIEDPIEYLIEGINQIQVNPVKKLTFATGLKSMLRHDPNVILIGEIRDLETAEIAFRASLNGHLVFSTLHTNNAVASISRLLDIGLDSYLILSSIILIVAQRLIKTICPHCKEECLMDADIINKFKFYIDKFNIKKFYKGKGCSQCSYTGFANRTAIFEMFKFNYKIRNLIFSQASEEAVFKEARKGGLKILIESGMEKVAQGLITLQEVANIAEEGETPPQPAGKTETEIRILVAEDEEHVFKILENRLHSAGYKVLRAKDGNQAVESAVKEKPDLIIMDVMMPEMDGFEATKILRSRLETAVIPIMMLTAKKDLESELKGIDLGADDYMTKPFEGSRLLARINMLLRKRK